MIDFEHAGLVEPGHDVTVKGRASSRFRARYLSYWKTDKHRPGNWQLAVNVEEGAIVEEGQIVTLAARNNAAYASSLRARLHSTSADEPATKLEDHAPPESPKAEGELDDRPERARVHFVHDCAAAPRVAVESPWEMRAMVPDCPACGDEMTYERTENAAGAAPRAHIYIATPTRDPVVGTRYAQSLYRARAILDAAGVRTTLRLLAGGSIQQSRNRLLASFLRSAATHMLFIDDDLGWRAEDLVRMIAADRDVVAGCYALREIDWTAVHAAVTRGVPADELRSVASPLMANLVLDRDDRPLLDGHLARAYSCGAGFLLLKREAIDRMIASYPGLRVWNPHDGEEQSALFDTSIATASGRRQHLTEDITFFERWRAIGGDVWIDTLAAFEHVGAFAFTAPTLNAKLRAGARGASSVTVEASARRAQPAEMP